MLQRLIRQAKDRLARRQSPSHVRTGAIERSLAHVLCIVPVLAIVVLTMIVASNAAQPEKENTRPPAPSLDGGIAWINTENPIAIEDLKGRIVLLDFWTLCCINCIHTLPDLAKLEAKYPGILVVLGIHTPKFPNEARTDSVRKAILRYQIKHPVVNDAEWLIGGRYRNHIKGLPTLVLIDPEGNVVGSGGGEGNYDILDAQIARVAELYRAKKMLKEDTIAFRLAEEKRGPLFFPGKVLADASARSPPAAGEGQAEQGRLFIADSTHHRVVITDLEGRKIAVAGTGVEGNKDGSFDKAQFADPQGLALDGDTLYVADRKNHQIRALDLKTQTVRTLAGTGQQDRRSRKIKGGEP